MNPFVTFLVLAPLVVSLFLWVGAIAYSINQGLTGGVIVMNVVFGGLSVTLVYLLLKTARSPMIDDKEIEHLDTLTKRRLTNVTLAVIYFTIFICLAFVTKLESVRNWIGILSTLMAISMLVSALWKSKESKKEHSKKVDQLQPVERERREIILSRFLKTKSFLFFSSLITVLMTSFLFWRFDGSQLISTFDFVGILALLMSFNFWFFMSKTNL